MSINFLYLRAFHTVATERSFTRAAQILRVGQSTLSAQVKAMEDRCGLRLLDRGREVVPTPLGREVLKCSREIFRLQDEIEALLHRGRELESGRLKIGADGPKHIVPVMGEFTRRHPNVALALITGNARKVLRDLLNYETDVAIVAMAKPRHSGVHMIPFCTYPLLAFVSRDHDWADRRSVNLKDFDGKRVLIRESSSLTRQIFLNALTKANARPSSYVEIDNREASREAVAQGMGIGVMSATEFPSQDTRTVPLSIGRGELTITEYVACLEKRRKVRAIEEFFQIALAQAPSRQ